MAYQAPLVVLAILFVQLWRSVVNYLGKVKGTTLPWFAQYYVIFYAYMGFLAVSAIMDWEKNIMGKTDWLDPDAVAAFVRAGMTANNESEAVFNNWEEEASLADYPKLKTFVKITPFILVLTWLTCVYHTYDHVRVMRKNDKELWQCPAHDGSITILGLPMVYGLMSFKSMMRILQICINHVPNPHAGDAGAADAVMFQSTEERKNFLLEMYDTNFEVGDIYETIALVTFGQLVMTYLNSQLEIMREAIDRKFEIAKAETTEVDEVLKTVEGSMKSLTTFGVQLFAITCALQGGYNVVVTGFGFYFPDFHPEIFGRSVDNPGLLQQATTKKFIHDFCFGMSMVSSTAAISNVMMIEHDFHHLLLKFKPSCKFWGTKILVSLAAIQSCAEYIPPFSGWFPTEVKWGVFYSSMLILECWLIAGFHFTGWNSKEAWYHHSDEEWDTSIRDPLLSKFKGGVTPA